MICSRTVLSLFFILVCFIECSFASDRGSNPQPHKSEIPGLHKFETPGVYEYALMDLSNELIKLDFLLHADKQNTSYCGLKKMVKSDIQWSTFIIVNFYNKYGPSNRENNIVRCAITKKLRQLVERKEIFFPEKTSREEFGEYYDQIMEYLKSTCPGETIENWANGGEIAK